MSRLLQPLWLIGCIGLSAGIDHVMQPRVDYTLSAGERTLTTGSLVIEESGRIHRFHLATIHVVAADVPRLLTTPLSVRTLWLRSPEQTDQPVPDVELLFDLAAGSGPIDPQARDGALLRAHALPVLPQAPGAEKLRSQVRLPGADAPAPILSGEFVIREALELEKGDPSQGWRVRGDLLLVTGEADQPPRSMTGKVDARLVW